MKKNVKKSFYRKWSMQALAIILLIMVATGCSEENTAQSDVVSDSVEETNNKEENKEPEKENEVEYEEKDSIEPEQEEYITAEPNTLMSGESGVLSDNVFVGLGEDKKNLDEMMNYITAKNQDALTRMLIEGKIMVAEKGTPITVVDRGFLSAKIELSETGERGYVPVEFLAKEVE